MAGVGNLQPVMDTSQTEFFDTTSQISQLQEMVQRLANERDAQQKSNTQVNQDLLYLREQMLQGQGPRFVPPTLPPPLPTPPSPTPILDLKLQPPPPFSGTHSELRSFQLRLCEYLQGCPSRYHDDRSRMLFSSSVLQGSARKWYEGLLDPYTNQLPPDYTFDSFLVEMQQFFGGGINLMALERDLANLRQTGSVSEYAIKFQNITNSFHPRWPDHPLIFQFSLHLNSGVRSELIGRGSPPLTFQAYVAAAVLVEMNQADARSVRGGGPPSPAPRPPFLKQQGSPHQPRLPAPPSNPMPDRMDIDGTRPVRGPLSQEERKRRFEGGLCAYCGRAGHVSQTCPNRFQARGTFHVPNGFQLVPQASPHYPGAWHQLPAPALPPSHQLPAHPPATLPADTRPGNSSPSQ